jgi:hypothetical protein
MRDPQGREVSRVPIGAYKIATNAYDRDAKEIAGIADSGRAAQADNIRIQQMRDILQNAVTGPGTTTKAELTAWIQRWAPASLTGWERESANIDGPAAIQMFNKLGLTGAGTQERGVLGSRGGFQAIKMFQAINPGAQLLNSTNAGLLAKQAISNQADADYSLGAQTHFATQETRFGTENKYTSLAQFDQQWQSQRNPQVYAAAIGALAGQKPEEWAKGLTDDEYKRALDVVSRADPSSVVNGKSGRISMQPNNGAAQAAPIAAPGEATSVPTVKTAADYDALKPGPYIDPDGHTRLKK